MEAFVALGRQRYQVQRPWPDERFDPQGISDVTVMADGRVVALMRSAPQLIIFSPAGQITAQWTLPELVSGHYLSARPGGGLLVVDWDAHQVLAIDNTGQCLWRIGEAAKPEWMAPFSHPTSAAEGADGRIYVSDGYGNFCLHRFTKDRTLQATIGCAGNAPGEFSTPHCVALDADGNTFVADRENNRIQVFNAEGVFQRTFGRVYKPMAVVLAPCGNLLITDQTPSLSLMSREGELLGRCRTSGMYGHGLACAPDGTIYVAEMMSDALVRMTPVD